MTDRTKKNAWLHSALRNNGYTQADLATRWGVDASLVNRYINQGDLWLTDVRIAAIADMIGMSHDEIVERDGKGYRRSKTSGNADTRGLAPLSQLQQLVEHKVQLFDKDSIAVQLSIVKGEDGSYYISRIETRNDTPDASANH
ncbi:helix-turn-helix domain-containing protein [Shinella zoogloeoides]|uniref:helix-turn-helix domain-containing protein n=1 Tax=Shinella zoogloeoides TaxID=352475 RepID=UPI00273D2B58|nr:helix-turn-helix transcriptional regulator [Shinella zoogloeoides]WLR92188.1 helix-turn-helix transcriptional regulator [Shinella zoogloeoides]